MSRGYFQDMKDMEKHRGKVSLLYILVGLKLLSFEVRVLIAEFEFWMQISKANKIVVPATSAVKFPTLEVKNTDGSSFKLPLVSKENDANVSTLDTAKGSSPKMSPTFKLNDTNATTSDTAKASLICLSFRASSGVRLVYIYILKY